MPEEEHPLQQHAQSHMKGGSDPLNWEELADFVKLSGDTMTGLLTLSGPPVNDLHAVTKKYMDDHLYSPLVLDAIEYADDETARAAYVTSDAEGVEESFETGLDNDYYLGDKDDLDFWQAKKFTTSRSILCTSASIWVVGEVGTVVGDVTFRIETDIGDEPSGTLVHANATGTIAKGDISIGAWNKCSFTPFSLATGTYWLVLSIPNQGTNDRWNIGTDGDGIGISAHSTDGGANWTIRTNVHMLYFRVYAVHLQSYSEASIKQQGFYSLKSFAEATDSLNDTLTRTIALPKDLSGQAKIKFHARASRTGTNFKVGFHDSGGITTEHSVNIASANVWQEEEVDISEVTDANKDVIDQIIITITNADADNIIYLDYINAPDPGVLGGEAGFGDMLKSVYDTDDDSRVNDAAKLAGYTLAQVRDHAPRAHTLNSHSCPDGNVDFGGYKGVDVANPTNPQDAATKAYVDSLV